MPEARDLTEGAAEIALERAGNEMTRRFAELEIVEIEAVVAVLTRAGAPPPSPDELDGAEAGPEFDRLFVEAGPAGREEGLAIRQPLSDGSEITMPAATAKLAEESTRSHIAMLQTIRGMPA